LKTIITLLFLVTILTGCSKGLDRTFDTSSQEAFNKSMEEMISESNKEEAQIFRSHAPALLMGLLGKTLAGDLPDLSKVTGREFLSKYLHSSLQKQKTLLQGLDVLKQASAEIQKISLENITYGTSSGFMGKSQPEVTFDVINRSSIPLHTIRAQTRLFLDGQSKPAADSTTYKVFRGGLAPGEKSKARINPGGASGNDGGWDKLSVKKAINPKITVRLVEVQDYDKRRIKVFNPRDEQAIKSRIETLKGQINIIGKR